MKNEKSSPYQCERVAQQHEPRAVVGQILAHLIEGLVDYLVVILADFVGGFVDKVCSSPQNVSMQLSVLSPSLPCPSNSAASAD